MGLRWTTVVYDTLCASAPSLPSLRHLQGTGKSTVARAFGEVFAKLGILAGADVVERKASGYFCVYWSCLFVYSRVPSLQASDLIGTHQNQSAPLVNAAMDEALGGVLIIDEVGGLAAPPSRSMAHEVVEALLGE